VNRRRIDVAATLAADTDHAIELAPRIWWVGRSSLPATTTTRS
jgi:hypothetical protein